jgi:hypothetical protein
MGDVTRERERPKCVRVGSFDKRGGADVAMQEGIGEASRLRRQTNGLLVGSEGTHQKAEEIPSAQRRDRFESSEEEVVTNYSKK